MANRGFLRPVSVQEPPQGDFKYLPVVIIKEAATAAELEVLLNLGSVVQSEETDWFWVIERIDYEVAVLQPMIGGNPAILSYSALVHATQVIKN
jgi:hypothetical protein